uniref:Reverse transcriptase domain-containing protein n=1 Tax=Tanacetum cinerariifolium TaxID=118510 RepID=A0A6L2KSU3_TANCI|nr:reverse transcriptase domain-containing protein [Tanacetum cinerariifolium]
MYDEYNALVKNGTWLIVPWLAGGLVANGSSWQLGVDFDETFSLVFKPTTIRIVFSLAVSRKWLIHQLDVKNAFLNGDSSETINMYQPPGFVDARQVSQVAYLLIYVDDIILTSSYPSLLLQLIGSLPNEFDMTDLGALNYFFGISAGRTPRGLFLSHKKYALQLLENAYIVTCKPSQKPFDTESRICCFQMYLAICSGDCDFGIQFISATTSLVDYTYADWAACPSTQDSQMHNNIMAVGSRDRPPILTPGRYPQWRLRFLQFVDTRPNSEALRKCILIGPYKPTTVLVHAIEATDDSPAVLEHTTVETPTNMSPENKAHFLAEKPKWSRFVTIVKQQHKLDEVSYHKLFDILKQYQNEVNELRAEKLARNANPLALVATDQASQDPFYQLSRSHRSSAPSLKPSIPSRSHTTTRHKGKHIAKPITPLSEIAFEEDINLEQSQRDNDMQKNLALIAKYFKKIYKPTNNNLRTSSNSKNNNVDTTPRYKNDDHSRQFGNQRTVNAAAVRENVGSKVVQEFGSQCFNCKEYGHFAKECRKPKRVNDSAYHKEKMLLYKKAEQGVPLQAEQYDWLADTDEEVDEQELEAHYSYMAKIQEVPTADSGTDSEPNEQNDVESDDERVMLANLKLDVDENKKIQKQLKKANTTLAQELKECKAILAETSKSLGESISVRDSCLVKLQTKQVEFEKYKAFNDRTIDYDKLERKLNEALGQLSHKDTVIKEGLKTKAYELSVVKKHDELMKQSPLTKSHYEGLVKQKTKGDSLKFVHELKQEMHADLKYVETLEKEIDELESKKAKFSDMYDVILQECVSKDVMCSYLQSLSYLDALAELQCLSKPVTAQTLPPVAKKAVSNTNVLKPGMYRIDNRIAHTRAQQLPQNVRNTNLYVSTSIGVNHKLNVSRPQLKSNQSRDKVLPNNSQVKVRRLKLYNTAVGGTFMQKTPEECYELIENMTVHHDHKETSAIRDEASRNISSTSTPESLEVVQHLEMMNKNFSEMMRQFQTIKAVDTKCKTCGGPHSFTECPAVGGYTQETAYATRNTVPNPREDLKAITTHSGVTLAGPLVFPSSSKEVNREPETITNEMPEVTKDMVQPSTKNIQPPVAQKQNPIFEPVVAPNPKPTIPYSSRVNKQKLREKDDNLALKFVKIFRNLHFELSFADALLYMPKFSLMFKSLLNNKEKSFDLAMTPVNENCLAVILKKLHGKLRDLGKFLIPYDFPEFDECLALADLGASINLMPLSIWKNLSFPELTSTQMILELVDRSTTRPAGIAEDVFVKVGKFHFPTDFVFVDYVVDPRVPLILLLRTGRALIDVYGEELTPRVDDEAITFKVGQTSKYSYNDAESINRINVIDVACEEYVQEVLGFSDNSKSGNPTRISDPIIAISFPSLTPFEGGDFILEEIEACLTSKLIPPGVDDTNLDLEGDIRCLEELLNNDLSLSSLPPKELNVEEIKIVKSSIDEPPELELKDLPSHLEYTYLEGTDKLPLIITKDLKDDEKEAFLKVLKSHKQAIAWKVSDIKGIDPRFYTHKILMEEDYKPTVQSQRRANPNIHEKGGINVVEKENNELTPNMIGHRMPFGLCNAPGTFQRCMMAIFHDMIEKTMEVFMDDFSVFGDSFSSCLSHLDTMLQRCEDTNLVLNWEKSHFMVKEGIVLGHKILKNGLEVDRAKVNVIAKLPHPMTIKGVRSFLGHVDFYRRFIQDLSKIARPMTHLLEKETPFVFSKDCIDAFETLKKKLTEAPI